MNIRCSVILVLIFYSFDVASQEKDIYLKDSLIIAGCPKEVIDISSKKTLNSDETTLHQFPFSSIEFRDVRCDTSYIGVISSNKVNFNKNYFKKIIFPNNTSTSLRNFFYDTSKYSFAASGEKLLCFVKHLRFSQVDSTVNDGNERQLYNR